MAAAFEHTRWSLIQQTFTKVAHSKRERAWEEFYQLYRVPLLNFIKVTYFDKNEAEDILQSFLTTLANSKGLDEADPDKGKMRNFLLIRLKRHILDHHRFLTAKKRGGKNKFHHEVDEDSLFTSSEDTHNFDKQWAESLLQLALGKLKQECDQKNKSTEFKVLSGQITGSSELQRARAAQELNISLDALRMKTSRLRKKFQQFLEHEVAQTLSPDEDIQQEMLYLANVLSKNS